MREDRQNRRSFFKVLGGAIGAVFALPAALAHARPMALRLENAKKLKTVGGWAILKIKGKPVLFIRDGKESIQVLDPTCTHRQCTVTYNDKSGRIECPCHQSAFDVTGKVLKGPAKEPLKRYEARLYEDKVLFHLK